MLVGCLAQYMGGQRCVALPKRRRDRGKDPEPGDLAEGRTQLLGGQDAGANVTDAHVDLGAAGALQKRTARAQDTV